MAIGASRGVLVRQLLTESMVFALLGGAAGIGVGALGIRFLQTIKLPLEYPIDLGIRMDTRLLVFSLALSVLTGIVFGLLPALRATRMDFNTTMKSGDQGPAKPAFWRGRLAGRNVLVSAQLAMSVVLLVASGLFVRGFVEARKMNPGFRVDHTLLVHFGQGADPTPSFHSLMRFDPVFHGSVFLPRHRHQLGALAGPPHSSSIHCYPCLRVKVLPMPPHRTRG